MVAKYELSSTDDFTTFHFVSIGPKGSILKRINFQWLGLKIAPDGKQKIPIFNLSFGDVRHVMGEIDDTVVSGNNDMERVLLTVASATYRFFESYPGAILFFVGSTDSRTRLYQIGITKHHHILMLDSEIQGFIENKWEPFDPRIRYQGFLFSRKNTKFVHRF